MKSPKRRLLQELDYQRHKVIRRIRKRRKRLVESALKLAEKWLRKKIQRPSYDGGKDDEDYYTKLERVAELNYKKWGFDTVEEAFLHAMNDNTYDYKGYYGNADGDGKLSNADTHWPDTYKTAYHPTFSRESQYSGKKSQYNPKGLVGGKWTSGPVEEFIPSWWLMFPNMVHNRYDDGKDDDEVVYANPEEQQAYNARWKGYHIPLGFEETQEGVYHNFNTGETLINYPGVTVTGQASKRKTPSYYDANHDYASSYNPNGLIEFADATVGMPMSLLSSTHVGRGLYNHFTGDGSQGNFFQDLFLPNNGVFSDEFAKEHPYITMVGNLVGDVAAFGTGSTLLKMPKYRAALQAENRAVQLAVARSWNDMMTRTSAQGDMFRPLTRPRTNLSMMERPASKLTLRERQGLPKGEKAYTAQENHDFLNQINDFAAKYGYPGLEEGNYTAQELESYARALIDRHNSFYRGVVMPEGEDLASVKRILGENASDEDIMRYMATHGKQGENGMWTFISPKPNAFIYGETARVTRPYSLGADRTKWFTEGDYPLAIRDPNTEWSAFKDYKGMLDPWGRRQSDVHGNIGYSQTVPNEVVSVNLPLIFRDWVKDYMPQSGKTADGVFSYNPDITATPRPMDTKYGLYDKSMHNVFKNLFKEAEGEINSAAYFGKPVPSDIDFLHGLVKPAVNPGKRLTFPEEVVRLIKEQTIPRMLEMRPYMKGREREILDEIDRVLSEGYFLPDDRGTLRAITRGNPNADWAAAYYTRQFDEIVNGLDTDPLWSLPHELRHKIDNAIPLTQEEEELLKAAYGLDFIDAVSAEHPGYTGAKREWVTTNRDSRNKYLELVEDAYKKADNIVDDKKELFGVDDFVSKGSSIEDQNIVIDHAWSDKVMLALKESNNYGRDYVNFLHEKEELLISLGLSAEDAYNATIGRAAEAIKKSWKAVGALIPGFIFGTQLEDSETSLYNSGKNKILIKPKNRGKFNALKKRTGKTTEQLTHSKNPLTRKRAIFALNSKQWSKKR